MVLLHRAAKGVASVIGLGQEAYASRQQKKAADNVNGSQITVPKEVKDAINEELDPSSTARDQPAQSNASSNRESSNDTGTINVDTRLPAPVIIPQRRPNARRRGLLCAYAPALEECGISQAKFLEFLDGFRSQAEKGAVFNAINLAVAATDWALELAELSPSPSMHFAATAVHLSMEAGKKLYINKKTNEYLDNMNEEMFKPRGLYAMIMTYDPSNDQAQEKVDFGSHTAAAVNTSLHDGARSQFRTASATTLESQMPEACTLIFPESNDGDEEEGGFKKSLNFVQGYYDRRSQAAYAAHNPESSLNVQEHEFAGRYADPTTFENSCVLGVLTNGVIDPRAARQERKAAKESGKEEKEKRGGLVRSLKGKISEGVLYLLVVNLPSEEELSYAKESLAKRDG